MSWIRSNVLGLTAIFIALCGTAAAAGIKANSVTSKSIENGAITSADVKDDGLTGDDIREATLSGIQGARGATGPQGPQGEPGASGPPGTNATINGVAASGDLTGTYPSPTVANSAIGGAEVTDDSLDGFDVTNLDGGSIAGGAITAPHLSSSVRPRSFSLATQAPEVTLAQIGELEVLGQCFWQGDLAQAALGLRVTGTTGRIDVLRPSREENGTQTTTFMPYTELDNLTTIMAGADAADVNPGNVATEGLIGTYTSANRGINVSVFATADDGGAGDDGICRFRGMLTPTT